MPNPAQIIAWDIETVPQRLSRMSVRQLRRVWLEVKRERERNPDRSMLDTIRLVCSLHPMIGRICCISIVRMTPNGQRRAPHSYTAATADDEGQLLYAFWHDVANLRGRILWVTFNGKRFDCDWLRVRSAAHGIAPTRRDILDTYPFRHEPHCDLSRLFDCRSALADVCDLVGIPSPKTTMDGSQVAHAVEQGRIDDAARYCEADVIATLAAYEALSVQV
jgi:hypothetical protein